MALTKAIRPGISHFQRKKFLQAVPPMDSARVGQLVTAIMREHGGHLKNRTPATPQMGKNLWSISYLTL